jgi:hypothetical protein
MRPSIPLLGQTSMDAWSAWFAAEDHPFARAWAEFFPTPELRAAGTEPDPEAQASLEELAEDAFEYFLGLQTEALRTVQESVRKIEALPLLTHLLFKTHFAPWGTCRTNAS